MGQEFMKSYNLIEDEFMLVSEGNRFFGMQFASQGQAHIHIGETEWDEGDAMFLVSKINSTEPSTFSVGQLPEGAKVWLRKLGTGNVKVNVLAY